DPVAGRHGGGRVAFGGWCEGHAAAGEAGAAKLRPLGSRRPIRRARVVSGHALTFRKSAAPASPAAARRRPCPPAGTLAVLPRPETGLGSVYPAARRSRAMRSGFVTLKCAPY